jgi:RNA polymerase sigma-70 factor (ECF subfamily)
MCSERVDQQNMASDGLLGTFIASRSALSRYLLLRGATAEEAEDILQEIYLKLSVDTIGPVAEPRAYLYRMTNNHFLGHRRAAGRRLRREEDWVDAHSGEEREVDEQPSAEARLIAREQLAILQRVLDGLPERTRMIFRRFRIDGEPQRQIAADIGISVSAVEKHLARAYEAIAAAKLRLDGDHSDPRHLRGERGHHGI